MGCSNHAAAAGFHLGTDPGDATNQPKKHELLCHNRSASLSAHGRQRPNAEPNFYSHFYLGPAAQGCTAQSEICITWHRTRKRPKPEPCSTCRCGRNFQHCLVHWQPTAMLYHSLQHFLLLLTQHCSTISTATAAAAGGMRAVCPAAFAGSSAAGHASEGYSRVRATPHTLRPVECASTIRPAAAAAGGTRAAGRAAQRAAWRRRPRPRASAARAAPAAGRKGFCILPFPLTLNSQLAGSKQCTSSMPACHKGRSVCSRRMCPCVVPNPRGTVRSSNVLSFSALYVRRYPASTVGYRAKDLTARTCGSDTPSASSAPLAGRRAAHRHSAAAAALMPSTLRHAVRQGLGFQQARRAQAQRRRGRAHAQHPAACCASGSRVSAGAPRTGTAPPRPRSRPAPCGMLCVRV